MANNEEWWAVHYDKEYLRELKREMSLLRSRSESIGADKIETTYTESLERARRSEQSSSSFSFETRCQRGKHRSSALTRQVFEANRQALNETKVSDTSDDGFVKADQID